MQIFSPSTNDFWLKLLKHIGKPWRVWVETEKKLQTNDASVHKKLCWVIWNGNSFWWELGEEGKKSVLSEPISIKETSAFLFRLMKQDSTSFPAFFFRIPNLKVAEEFWAFFFLLFSLKMKSFPTSAISYLSSLCCLVLNFPLERAFLSTFTREFCKWKRLGKHQKTRFLRNSEKFKLLFCDYNMKFNCILCLRSVERWNIFVQIPTTFNLKLKVLCLLWKFFYFVQRFRSAAKQ